MTVNGGISRGSCNVGEKGRAGITTFTGTHTPKAVCSCVGRGGEEVGT